MDDAILTAITAHHSIDAHQQENISRLIRLSNTFSKRIYVESVGTDIGDPKKTCVLECGHQPNFLPHSATWKKAFFLKWLCKKVESRNLEPVAFFGFADQNISTARLLTKNQILESNKNGFVKIGFKIKNENKMRSFRFTEKPPIDQWEAEIGRIRRHYLDLSEKTRFKEENVSGQREKILEIMWSSYEIANNFPELNAVIFTRICREILDINLVFFLYSDIHRNSLFLEESKKILEKLPQFNRVYNDEINSKQLDIPEIQQNRLPFWYECTCGMKLDLLMENEGMCRISCPACGAEKTLDFGNSFENIHNFYRNMDFNGVSRNIIMAEGLGDSVFITGTGGSLVYGRISDTLSETLGFHRPVILAWQSKDFYVGMMQKIVIRDLMKTFSLEPGDFSQNIAKKKIEKKLDEIAANLQNSITRERQQEIRYWSGVQNSANNLIASSRNFFCATPSFIDILSNYTSNTIIKIWERAIETSEFQEHGYVYRAHADTSYPGIFYQEICTSVFPDLLESKKIPEDPHDNKSSDCQSSYR